jgi:hypothetical protein
MSSAASNGSSPPARNRSGAKCGPFRSVVTITTLPGPRSTDDRPMSIGRFSPRCPVGTDRASNNRSTVAETSMGCENRGARTPPGVAIQVAPTPRRSASATACGDTSAGRGQTYFQHLAQQERAVAGRAGRSGVGAIAEHDQPGRVVERRPHAVGHAHQFGDVGVALRPHRAGQRLSRRFRGRSVADDHDGAAEVGNVHPRLDRRRPGGQDAGPAFEFLQPFANAEADAGRVLGVGRLDWEHGQAISRAVPIA